MAYRKRRTTTKRRHTTHRRRMGGIGRKDSMTRLAGLVVGAVTTGFINKTVGTKLDPKILAALEVGAGYFLPGFIKGEIAQGVGDGMIAAGGLSLLKQFGVVSGIPIIAGPHDLATINGPKQEKKPIPMNDMSSYGSYRPSISQILNGIANRTPMDGSHD